MPCLSSPQLALDAVAGLWEFNLSLFSLSIKEELVRFILFFFLVLLGRGLGAAKAAMDRAVVSQPCRAPYLSGQGEPFPLAQSTLWHGGCRRL